MKEAAAVTLSIGIPEPRIQCPIMEISRKADREVLKEYNHLITPRSWGAEFIGKLKDTADGDGTLLDRAVIYFGSGMSNGNQHDRNTPPAVLVGGANGRMKGNNHVAANRAPAVNLLLNIAEMADVRVEKIGSMHRTAGSVSLGLLAGARAFSAGWRAGLVAAFHAP